MKKIINILVCISIIIICLSVLSSCTMFKNDSLSGSSFLKQQIDYVCGEVCPSLVNIEPIVENYYGGKKEKTTGTGSGVILSTEGYVLTNYHVTQGAKVSLVTLYTKETIKADLVGEDPLTDLAVMKLRLNELPKGSDDLTPANFGNSDKVEVGDYVLAMGSPYALSQSVTLGIINNNQRIFQNKREGVDPDLIIGKSSGLLTRWLQHDASISPGNSGGPLVNLKGEVIGINELGSFFGGDMGFAIPSNLAEEIYTQLIAQKYVSRSWLGLIFQPLPQKNVGKGVIISSVSKDSPGSKAGLMPGDILLEINGIKVDAHFDEEIPEIYRLTADIPVSKNITVKFLRNNVINNVKISPIQQKEYKGEEAELKKWGITIQEITEPFARESMIDFTDGVKITGVRAGGVAANAKVPIVSDDILKSIEGKPIKNIEELKEAYKELTTDGAEVKDILVEVWRNEQNVLSVMKSNEKEESKEDKPQELGKAWVGCAVQVLTEDLADKLGVEKGGVRLTRVYKNAPSAKAGLMVGDIVKSFDNNKILASQPYEIDMFKTIVRKAAIDEPVDMTIIRDKKEMNLKIIPILEPTNDTSIDIYEDKEFELTVRGITFNDRMDKKYLEGVNGLIITVVEPAGWAGFGGLHNQDILISIDDQIVDTVDKYKEVIKKIKESKEKQVKFFIQRRTTTSFIFIEPDWEE